MRVKLHTVENARDIDGPVPTFAGEALILQWTNEGWIVYQVQWFSGECEGSAGALMVWRAGAAGAAEGFTFGFGSHWVSFSLGSIVNLASRNSCGFPHASRPGVLVVDRPVVGVLGVASMR